MNGEAKTVFLKAVGRAVKLGRVKPKVLPPVPRLASYLGTPRISPPPRAVDYAAKATPAIRRMYVNDQLGCCVVSDAFHSLGVWSANDGGAAVQGSDADVVREYNRLKAGPGDSGCVISDVLAACKAGGITADGKAYTIDGFVSADNANQLEVQVALYLFGGLTLGLDLPAAWLDAPDGGVWDATDTQIVGGHDVLAVGYSDAGVVVSTWGGLRTITWAAFTSRRWVTECYAKLAPLWYGSDRVQATTGFDYQTLRADLDKLGGGEIPDPLPPSPPVVPPVVPPPPPVVVPPVAPVVSDIVVTGQLPSGVFGHLTTVTLRGTATPRPANAPAGWPHLADFERLVADVLALVQSGEVQTVEAAVIALIADIRAGKYGAALAVAVATLPAIQALAAKVSEIIERFRTASAVPVARMAMPGAFLDWLAAHPDVVRRVVEELLHLAA